MESHETFTSKLAETKAVSPILDPLNGDNKSPANDICKMIEFLVDNIYVRFGGQLFRQMIGILMGTKCALLLTDWFLCFYENEFQIKSLKCKLNVVFPNLEEQHNQEDGYLPFLNISFSSRVTKSV